MRTADSTGKHTMKAAQNESTSATRATRCRSVPGKALLLCSDLLDLCGEAGPKASRRCGSLVDAVRNAERSRHQREYKALAPPL
jgi:hypothetical protein